jgi:hypothetical protein
MTWTSTHKVLDQWACVFAGEPGLLGMKINKPAKKNQHRRWMLVIKGVWGSRA